VHDQIGGSQGWLAKSPADLRIKQLKDASAQKS
jgi:hypothetical protein